MSTVASTQRLAPSLAVVQRVANREGVDPTELSPLHDSIDPDALDSLVDGSLGDAADFELEFTYCGYTITVTGEGVIHLDETVRPETLA